MKASKEVIIKYFFLVLDVIYWNIILETYVTPNTQFTKQCYNTVSAAEITPIYILPVLDCVFTIWKGVECKSAFLNLYIIQKVPSIFRCCFYSARYLCHCAIADAIPEPQQGTSSCWQPMPGHTSIEARTCCWLLCITPQKHPISLHIVTVTKDAVFVCGCFCGCG